MVARAPRDSSYRDQEAAARAPSSGPLLRSLPSLQDYLLVSRHAARIEHYARQNDAWLLRTYGPGSIVPLVSLALELPVDDLYEGIL